MRPVRITGVTGTSPIVPLDVYTIGTANAIVVTGGATAQLQYTLDDVFNTAITPTWTNTTGTGRNAAQSIPSGARGVQCINMVNADVLTVSQQGII